MKKFGKLTINPERVMKNEELINLRGGAAIGYTNCSTDCPNGKTISITDCNGTCTSVDGVSVECRGKTATLTKTCAQA